MGPIYSRNVTAPNGRSELGKILRAPFDAFKFPNSDVVQFKALVTPCMPHCEPVVCDVEDYLGYQRKIESQGKRRRRRDSMESSTDLLVIQSIRIADKFQAPAPTVPGSSESQSSPSLKSRNENVESEVSVLSSSGEGSSKTSGILSSPCLNLLGLLMAGALFLVAQSVLIGAWAFIWQKRRQSKLSALTDPNPDERERRFYAAQFANGAFHSS